MILRRGLDAGLPKPEYHPDNVDFKVIIWREPSRLGPLRAQSGLSQKSMMIQSPRESCLALLHSAEYGRKDLAAALGASSRTGYFGRMLAELVEDGLIELTIPEKPNSRLQKYRLTEKGRAIFDKGK